MLNVQEWPTDRLTPYAKNPRRNDPAVDAVAQSIAEFGFKVPIIVDAQGEIVAGHTRVKAAKKLRMKTVPVIVADDLTPEQARAFRLADNKVSELAGWDEELLREELSQIAEIDMRLFGFGLDEAAELEADEPEEDAQPGAEDRKEIKCPHCGMWFEP